MKRLCGTIVVSLGMIVAPGMGAFAQIDMSQELKRVKAISNGIVNSNLALKHRKGIAMHFNPCAFINTDAQEFWMLPP